VRGPELRLGKQNNTATVKTENAANTNLIEEKNFSTKK